MDLNRSFPHQASLGPDARVASAGMAFINRSVSDKLGRIGFESQFNFCFNVVIISISEQKEQFDWIGILGFCFALQFFL